MNALPLLALAFFATKGLATKSASEKLDFNLIGVKKKDGKLNLIATVTNPTKTAISVESLFLSFFVDIGSGPNKIGTITVPREKAFKVTKQGTTTLYLPITVGAFGLVKLGLELANAIKKKKIDKPEVRVVGTIVANGFTSTIDKVVPLDIL